MSLFLKLLSIWLWGGMLTAIYLYFVFKDEVEKVRPPKDFFFKLFAIFTMIGFPIGVALLFGDTKKMVRVETKITEDDEDDDEDEEIYEYDRDTKKYVIDVNEYIKKIFDFFRK